MPNPYTNFRNRRRNQQPQIGRTSKKVRIGSGGRRIRMIANQPIEKATPTGTEPIIEEEEINGKEKTEPKGKDKKKK